MIATSMLLTSQTANNATSGAKSNGPIIGSLFRTKSMSGSVICRIHLSLGLYRSN